MISVVVHGDKRRAERRTDAVARELRFAAPPVGRAPRPRRAERRQPSGGGSGSPLMPLPGQNHLPGAGLLESAAPPPCDAAGLRLETGTVRGPADPGPEPRPPPCLDKQGLA